MTPSPLPALDGLSYSARVWKPLVRCPAGGADCGVAFPNSSAPLSIVPLPLRSSTRNASSDPAAVHAVASGLPSASKSKLTPLVASVRLKPFPSKSINTGVLSIYPTQRHASQSTSEHHITH